jgi:VWFA-related protein
MSFLTFTNQVVIYTPPTGGYPMRASQPIQAFPGVSKIFRAFLNSALLLLIAHCSVLTIRAQASEPIETLRIDTDLVNLSVSVFSRNLSRAVPSLEQKHFAVFENGSPQEISFFASAQTPFDLVLLLDLSGSTADKIDLIRKSSKHFVDAARPNDRLAVITFTTEVRAVSLLTEDRQGLKHRIDQIEKSSSGTNLWDALRFVFEHVLSQSRAENRRSAIIVMTDGVDNGLPDVAGDGSKTSFEELLRIVGASDSIVLPIYLDTERETIKNRQATAETFELARKYLAQLADESGNLGYRARKVKDLDGVYEQVIKDLSTVYSIGYRPSNRTRDGAWRGVTVQLLEHPDLNARSKRGYFAK